MDGVLADFKTAAVKVNGMSIQKWMNIPSSQQKWERIKNTSNFWHNLPWMPGGQALWRFLTKFDPHILSAYVEETYDPNCIPGKTAWLRKNTRITDKSKIHLVRRREKKNFAKYGGQKNIVQNAANVQAQAPTQTTPQANPLVDQMKTLLTGKNKLTFKV